jgi:hypothetical protein
MIEKDQQDKGTLHFEKDEKEKNLKFEVIFTPYF